MMEMNRPTSRQAVASGITRITLAAWIPITMTRASKTRSVYPTTLVRLPLTCDFTGSKLVNGNQW